MSTVPISNSEFKLDSIKLIVGLGNIGKNYIKTRHNAGFLFVDYFLDKLANTAKWKSDKDLKTEIIEIDLPSGQKILLAKPTTMMNGSGEAARLIKNYYRIQPSQILIAHDDLDIPLGKYKIEFAHGPRIHNGIKSLDSELQTDQYWRIRIGIENRVEKGNKGVPGMRYALERFTASELEQLQQAFDQIITRIQ